jgi:acyl-CoA thioesterase-1
MFLRFVGLMLATVLAVIADPPPADGTGKTTPVARNPSLARIDDVPGLPRVLLLGDSISIGYTLAVREALKGRANVHRAPENCSATSHALNRLERWLGEGKWDVIHFNFGLHDAKLPPEGVRHAPPDVYEQNLRRLVARLKATGAKLIWATTTPVPYGGVLAPDRRFGDIAAYNAVASRVMKEHNIPVNDLNRAVAPHLERYLRPRDLHYTTEGSKFLAEHVVRSLEMALPERRQ